jgi:glycosyltransferase involved in cell wall biosynthesis
MKIAIVHDWLATYAGSERVVEQILALYPAADLFTLFDFMADGERSIIRRPAKTSFIQRLPFARTSYRSYLPLMPFAVERFDLSSYDLILSSSHAVAKGVRKRPDQTHVCYCHTPMRYAWDLREQYLRESGLDRGIKGMLARTVLERIRRWDERTADRVDHFIANSRYIAERIHRSYHRDAAVIYPPVDTDLFSLSPSKEEFYLAASRMVPYKRMDLIVEAFRLLPERKLVVIGDGPDLEKVKAKAGQNVELLGYQPGEVLRGHLQRARAFLFAAEEDFGILPVEAQACGTPVIAFGRGGVRETVIPLTRSKGPEEGARPLKPTGEFFLEQTTASIVAAVRRFEEHSSDFDPAEIRLNAERFGQRRFRKEYGEFVARIVQERPGRAPSANPDHA